MTKILQIDDVLKTLAERAGAGTGCALVARAGQGGLLCAAGLDGTDPALLGAAVSSVLLIGERLGSELRRQVVGYTLFEYGDRAVVILPCGEEAALLVALDGTATRQPAIAWAQEAAREIESLLVPASRLA
jgi:predicted regulator of Ras-like GTPase activity (Roadblock/LC7/MglB family)